MTHVDKRTLVRGAIKAAGYDLTAAQIEEAIEFEGNDIHRLLNAMTRDGEIMPRKGPGKPKVFGFPRPGEKPYVIKRVRKAEPLKSLSDQKISPNAKQSESGLFLEEKTATGKRVHVSPHWKPHREGRRYNVPVLLGYTSPLAGL